MGIVSLVLGVLGFVFCWVPLVGILTLPLTAIGILLGVIGIVIAVVRGGSGIGWPIAGLVTSGVAALIAGSQVAAIGGMSAAISDAAERSSRTNQTTVAPTYDNVNAAQHAADDPSTDDSDIEPEQDSAERPTSATADSPKWASADQPVRQADVQVRVVQVTQEQVPLKKFGRETKSESELLSIKIEVENLSTTTKLTYNTWQGADFGIGRDFATLADNFGNSYKRIDFGFSLKVVGRVATDSVYPGKSIRDLLVFELPIENTEYLDLELPAANFGGEGMLRIRIPRDMYPSAEELAQRAAERKADMDAWRAERRAAREAERQKAEAAKKAELERRAEAEESEFRTWTSRQGAHTTVAKLVSFAEGLVTIMNRDGKTKKVPIGKLSEEDGRYVDEWRSKQ